MSSIYSLILLVVVFLGLPAHASRAASPEMPWGPMNEITQAATAEGALSIYRAPGHITVEGERAITEAFQEKFGIRVSWTSLGGMREMVPRILTEQRTKQYVVDVAMAGFGPIYTTLKAKGYLLPILAPSTLERGVWRLDPATATPEDRNWLFINMALHSGFFVNTAIIPPGEEPQSYRDLLDPKWKGKIVMHDPGRGGPGMGWFRSVYKPLGIDYMKALANQVTVLPRTNDAPDAVVRGQYGVGVAISPTRGRQLIRQGAPVKFVVPKEGSYLSFQGIYSIVNAPHPNAARLFLHWFFTREGQEVYARKTLAISVRKDVGQDYLPADERYVEGQPYMMADPADSMPARLKELTSLGKDIFAVAREKNQ
jgi:iron(III) transport system substrate-binding protein